MSFSIVYAIPVGGVREHTFKSADKLSKHVWDNRPAIMVDAPKTQDEFDTQRRAGWSMPVKKRKDS